LLGIEDHLLAEVVNDLLLEGQLRILLRRFLDDLGTSIGLQKILPLLDAIILPFPLFSFASWQIAGCLAMFVYSPPWCPYGEFALHQVSAPDP
jgi:hypothetical protein